MHGIDIKAGVNACFWNHDGICVNSLVTRGIGGFDYASKASCTYTILGSRLCFGFGETALDSGLRPDKGPV